MERDFVYKGVRFHINDGKYNNEFSPKYTLLVWNDLAERWQECCGVDSKKEALEWVHGEYK